MSVADQVILAKSMFDPVDSKPIVEKVVLTLNDSNSGSYNGNIVFDSSVLSNSGRWLDWSQATLNIPLAFSIKSSVDITGSANAYMGTIKSGFHQLIDSLDVSWLNKNIIQQTSFTNFHVSYKVMSEWSSDDLEKWGDLTGIYPDSPANFTRSAAAAAKGDGFADNTPYNVGNKSFAVTAPLDQSNEGLRRRLEMTAQGTSAAYANLNTTTSTAALSRIGKSYFTDDGGAAAARIYTWYILATIRLADIHSFFRNAPLLRGGSLRMTIQYNAARAVITGVTAGPTMALTSVTMLAGRTLPFMVCDSTANQPCNGSLSLTGTATCEMNIRATVSPASANNPMLSACQLNVPAFTLSPEAESSYLSSYPIKNIIYDDLYQFVVQGVASGGQFNSIVTNGILNPQQLVIIPYVASGSTGNSQEQFRSPFDSAPATTAPLASLDNFQVYISGKSVFDKPVRYDYDIYSNEVATQGQNGGVVQGQSSGLISFKDWTYGYRYYVVDIARRLQSSDNVPLSIQVQGTNNSGATLDFYVFVTYQRSVQIELSTGVIASL
jgi:hypothetical protein